MISTKISGIIEELKSLTLLEASQLVKSIEETFDIDVSQVSGASSMMMPDQRNGLQVSVETEEKIDFNVILADVPSSKKIAILKVVRSITGLGLKDAKDLVESAPQLLKSGISKEDAQEIKNKLEQEGAKIEIS
jgi:large subunit ribosomal protein L7/L12|uniref:50S ribosomal protein L12, chloroplastic n=1 Tax=Thorea hispida TaxID=202687 RepID=A0A1C9CAP6_9FLOR|nr:ribosomal protein L12 [Thorea hispida]AOM65439.1 ribosomal protein L12 [Thorea hispida]ARX95808.1 50S ribosomal protein L12 [Thorea hispida]UNJ79098.1 ribosomal protein L12 [Thorea hispida]